MRAYEELEDGVKKYYSWGWVEIRAPFEECFTREELIEVLKEYKLMVDAGITDPKVTERFNRVREKVRADASRASRR